MIMNSLKNSNPYAGIDWENVNRITGCTHMHCVSAEILKRYLDDGLEFATISNYYPSTPWYPLASLHENFFRMHQRGYIRNGVWHTGELDLNAELMSWQDKLAPEQRNELPFKEGKNLFPDVPSTLLEAPNAEHHSFSDEGIRIHITAPGCALSSSSFDLKGQFGLEKYGGIQLGAPVPWREEFRLLLESRICPDGGGIVINHPTWSHLPIDFLCELMDFGPDVLGMEIYNHNCRDSFSDFSDSLWDAVLSTGRQCFGFCVQDHPTVDKKWLGRIVLLTEERTAEACLKAMRTGRFYGSIAGNGLQFDYLNFDGKTLQARCNREVVFQLISRTGLVGSTVRGREFTFVLNDSDREKHVFLRLTAQEGRAAEKLFAQPFMLV
ncbi:MAG: hypothetical protein J5858_17410 [Lentisphaeria bacterium]|nr:hypothetical protein [Lentisphaeria bacterium]